MRYLFARILLIFFISPFLTGTFAQTIKLNQIGFYPNGNKIAVVPGSGATTCKIVDEGGTEQGTFSLSVGAPYSASGETVQVCDFSSFTTTGRYKLVVDGVGESYYFDVLPSVHLGILKGSLRAYYYHRASSAITAQYGGIFTRAAGHPDQNVLVHSSAATTERPTGHVIASPKGWYDAGDYNKYIVNSGITTFTILSLYEHYPDYFNSLELGIPETGNDIPDILDEALWNIEWMLTMQDPNDGGVYHKCTSLRFSNTVQPSADVSTRYVVMKSTQASLDFAAVMAVASRIFKKFETEKPGLSAQCLDASVAAWNWAKANPTQYYEQPADVVTGDYLDNGTNAASDEFDWASVELFITTSDAAYLTSENVLSSNPNVPDWKNLRGLAWVSLGLHRDSLSDTDKLTVENKITAFGNTLYNTYSNSGYKTVMGPGSFYWGSNGVAANQGLMLLQAFDVSGDSKFLKAAMGNLDYLLGKNPTGYSFVTGFGSLSPFNIHHRISASDNVPGPLPGFLVGGPNKQAPIQDGCSYSSTSEALLYSDTYCSYSTNEIAINWNAPLAYLLGATEAMLGSNSSYPSILSHPLDQAAQAGTEVVFNVFASGSGIGYQWQKNGENIPGETSASLTLSSASASDEATYRVLVINAVPDTVISKEAEFRLLVKGPFGGVRHPIPGIVQAENYDEGGEGVGYHDTTPGNDVGGTRPDNVDAGTTVGYIATNEWLNYSVMVTAAGTYQLEFRVTSPGTTGRLSLLVDEVAVPSATNMAVPLTGGWDTYTSIYAHNIELTAGEHDLKILINAAGFNLDYFRIGTGLTGTVDKKGSGIVLYPNPSAEAFTMVLNAIKPGSTFILTSVDGKEVMNQPVMDTTFTFGETLEKGFYIGRIIEDDKVRVFQIVKQ